MSTNDHVGTGGKPPLPLPASPVLGGQSTSSEKVKSTSALLQFDPRRRESRPQQPPSSVAEVLSGPTRSPGSLQKPSALRAPPLSKTVSKPDLSLNSQMMLHNSKGSPKVVEQRRLSDTHISDIPMTTAKVHSTESDTNTPTTTDARLKPQRATGGEVEAIMSSADAPPGFFASQFMPNPVVTKTRAGPVQPQRAEEQSHRVSKASTRQSEPNPLAQATSSSNNNGETIATKTTTAVPLVSVESGESDWKRECEWLQVPILFYFFASLIEFSELQQNYLVEGHLTDTAHEQLTQLNTVGDRITYSVDEIKGILLNKLFASWSDTALRSRVEDVAEQWTTNGPRSDGFRDSSLALMDDISEDRPCSIRYTPFYVFRQFLGSKDKYRVTVIASSIMLVICIVCIVLLAVLGRKHLVACIVLSAVMGVVIILGYILILLLLHHNYYADAAEKFFRAQSLTVTKDVMNEDYDSTNNLWMGPLGTLPPPPSHDATFDHDSLENPRQDDVNVLRMSPLNYKRTQMSVSQLQAQLLRDSISYGDGDLRNASIDSLMGKDSSQQIVNSLTESISITALLYCSDHGSVEDISVTLWKNNFYVFCSTDLMALDAAYHRGSERFKVMLVSARELTANGARLKASLDWLAARRPIFFFSERDSDFPELVPAAARVHVPLTAIDVRRILLAGIAITEEDQSTRDDMKSAVPNYTLGRRLGGGAFGNVFEAQLEGTGAKCAVKRMYLKESTDDNTDHGDGPSKQLRDIAQEVEIMSSLAHPNIVQYFFCQREDNCISIFMELCSGGSLSSMIKKGEVDDAESIKRILSEILRAVAYLHNRRIVHRDLKPDNVLFRNNHSKVTDFGTAVHKRGELNIVTGTFAYMAPEILVGESYGKECDIWSIGCIAAEMLSIDLPQRGMGPPEMATLYRQMPLDSALEIKCDKPQIVAFLQACLKRNPANRASATGLLGAQMLFKESKEIGEWLVEVSQKKKLKRQQSGILTHNSSFDLSSGNMSLNSNQ